MDTTTEPVRPRRPMSDGDLGAIYDYPQTVAPVDHAVPNGTGG